jgi:hypothetical protein
MRSYAVTISYPTTDRYYRGQRGFVVFAHNEREARRVACATMQGSRIVRIRDRSIVSRVREYTN